MSACAMPLAVAPPRVLLPLRIDAAMPAPEGRLLRLQGACMGTRWQVSVVAHAARAEALRSGIAGTLEAVEAQMSHFRPDTPLCRFGDLPAGAWMSLPVAFAQVMRAALQVAHDSGGAFDPAAGASIDAWGFGARGGYRIAGFAPPPAPPPACGLWRQLVLDGDRLLQPGGVALNLSAIAKGYAVDAVCEWLAGQCCPHHLVDVGGELRGAGMKPDLQPWWVALETPAGDFDLPVTRIALHGLAVATSGDYRRSYRAAGRRLQHTIDPRSGMPVAHGLASVSVLHEACMLADAWSTAIMVLGPQAGLQLAEARGLRALLQWRDTRGRWREASSTGWQALQR